MAGREGQILQINGIDLLVRRFGDPALPVLVVIHGGPTWDHSYLLPTVAELADIRHVVLFDLRGCGGSGRHLPYGSLQPEYMVEDVRQLIDHLGIDRADVLGQSYGGMIAMSFVERHPGRVRSVVLASTTAYTDFDDELHALPDYIARSAMAVETDGAAYDGAPDGELSRAMAHDSLPLNVWDMSRWDEWRAVLDNVVFSSDFDDIYSAGELHSPRPADPAAALRAAGVPVLILHGEREMSFPVSVARRLHEAVPGSELVLVPDAAHMAHFDNPEAWLNAVRRFLG